MRAGPGGVGWLERPVEEVDDAALVLLWLLVDAVGVAALGFPDLLRLLGGAVVVGVAVAGVVSSPTRCSPAPGQSA